VQIRLKRMMAGHLVPFAAFLAQPHPEPPVLHEHVLDPHGQRGANPSEAVHHERDQRPVAQPNRGGDVDAVEQRPGLGRIEHRRLAFADTVGRSAHRGGGVERHDLAHDQLVEQVADGGELLLHRGRGMLPGLALDPGRHMQRLHRSNRGHRVILVPGQEVRYGAGLGAAGVRVAQGGGEEFQEEDASSLTRGGHQGGQAGLVDAGQHAALADKEHFPGHGACPYLARKFRTVMIFVPS